MRSAPTMPNPPATPCTTTCSGPTADTARAGAAPTVPDPHPSTKETSMHKRFTLKLLAACALAATAAAPAFAQTKLKWAHVYETSEPYHKWSVWAGDEIKKRTNGRYEVQVFPASTLGKESDINQGLQLGTVDIILTGASFASQAYKPLAVTYFPFIFRDAEHLLKYAKSDVFAELAKGYDEKSGNHIVALNYYGARNVTSS